MSMEYAADVPPAYEGRAMREHIMSTPGGGAHGDSGGWSRYGVPCSAAKRDGCLTIGISGDTYGGGDGEPNSDTDRSATELIDWK
jgi:hypothetical protein